MLRHVRGGDAERQPEPEIVDQHARGGECCEEQERSDPLADQVPQPRERDSFDRPEFRCDLLARMRHRKGDEDARRAPADLSCHSIPLLCTIALVWHRRNRARCELLHTPQHAHVSLVQGRVCH
jgi:hypothetical protein